MNKDRVNESLKSSVNWVLLFSFASMLWMMDNFDKFLINQGIQNNNGSLAIKPLFLFCILLFGFSTISCAFARFVLFIFDCCDEDLNESQNLLKEAKKSSRILESLIKILSYNYETLKSLEKMPTTRIFDIGVKSFMVGIIAMATYFILFLVIYT